MRAHAKRAGSQDSGQSAPLPGLRFLIRQTRSGCICLFLALKIVAF